MSPGRTLRPSDEQESLRVQARRRLVGAVVVIALLVVLAPLALDGESPVNDNIAVRMPTVFGPNASAPDGLPDAAPAAAPLSRPIVPREVSREIEEQFALPQHVVEARAARREAPTDVPGPVPSRPVAAAPSVAAKPAAAPAAPPAAMPARGYVVQVGVFGQRDNARAMVARITLTGVGAYSDSVSVGQGEALRVRAGPFATREAAEAALSRMSAEGIPGIVRAIDP